MVGLPRVVSQCAKLNVAGWTSAVFTRVYLDVYWIYYVTCGDFHDGSEKGTANVYQILCQSWETFYGDPHNDSTSLRGPNLESTQVFQWHAWFKTSRTSVDDDEYTGRPTSCTTPETAARIQEFVRQDRRRTIHDITEEVGIGFGTC
jgi:hypothetical protein